MLALLRANIFNRRDLELKKDGEFGTGEVKPRLILNVGGQHVRYQQEIPTETTEHAKKACIEKVGQTAKELAKSFSEFVDDMDEAKMKFPDHSEFKECTQRGEARTHCSDGSPRLDKNDEILNDPSFLIVVELMEKSFTKKPSCCTFDAPSFDLGVDFSQDDGIATAVRKRKKVGSGDEEGVMHQQPTTIASEERPMKRKSTTREQAAIYCSSQFGSGNVDGVMHQKGSTIAALIRRSPRVVSNSGDNDSLAALDVDHKGFVGVLI
ncbi:Histidine--tRNA ligase [Bienertia sinuspersici]